MELKTERLILIPLTARQLRLWTEDGAALERELQCSYDAEPLRGDFLEIVKNQVQATERDGQNFVFHSFWFILRKEDRVVVGSADFKAPPDENGEVEIGYGLGERYEHCGYMTETVSAMCRWAAGLGTVSRVTAETEADNKASHRVLERCGFTVFRRADTLWWHRAPEQTLCGMDRERDRIRKE